MTTEPRQRNDSGLPSAEPQPGDASDPRAINYIGKRAIAALWVINPQMFGDAPAQMVAKSFGISPLKFYHVTAEFSREFGVRNRFQVHDWQNKK